MRYTLTAVEIGIGEGIQKRAKNTVFHFMTEMMGVQSINKSFKLYRYRCKNFVINIFTLSENDIGEISTWAIMSIIIKVFVDQVLWQGEI